MCIKFQLQYFLAHLYFNGAAQLQKVQVTPDNMLESQKIGKNQNSMQKQNQDICHSSRMEYIPKLMPVEIQMGHQVFTLMPQYPFMTMELIVVTVRSIYERIPKSEPVYIINWTKGWRLGRMVQMNERLQDLLIESQAQYPSIRLFWRNAISYQVIVTVHDIMELEYKLDMFDELEDLLQTTKYELRKKFRLQQNYSITLETTQELANVKKSAYVGNFFKEGKVNKLFLLIDFKEKFSVNFAKQHFPQTYEELICPIIHQIMQQPVSTSCRHVFDRFAICLEVIQKKRCPICRAVISLRSLSKSIKHAKMIEKLDRVNYQQKMAIKKEEEQGRNQEQSEMIKKRDRERMQASWKRMDETKLKLFHQKKEQELS